MKGTRRDAWLFADSFGHRAARNFKGQLNWLAEFEGCSRLSFLSAVQFNFLLLFPNGLKHSVKYKLSKCLHRSVCMQLQCISHGITTVATHDLGCDPGTTQRLLIADLQIYDGECVYSSVWLFIISACTYGLVWKDSKHRLQYVCSLSVGA